LSKRDYYEVLGVEKAASGDQIKKSYRQLALKFHPDRNPDDKKAEESFKEASEAYQILSKSETRAKYDQYGHAGLGSNGFEDFSGFADEIFGDLFSAFFGGAGGSAQQRRQRSGRDLRYQLEVSLVEAAQGIEKTITLKKPIPCDGCEGSGSRDGSSPEACRHCGGSGQTRVQQGFFTIARTCSVCRGEGTMIVDPCPSCGGAAVGEKETELLVKVPAGIDTGQRLKLRGEGEAITDGPPGDLYVEIAIAQHTFFKRQDTEILCEFPITYCQATLGAEIAIPTLEGEEMLKIPPGTASAKVFRLRGKGIVDMHTGRVGDQHIRVYVYVPQTVTDEQREMLEALSKIEGKPTSNESRTFFDKVKDFFE